MTISGVCGRVGYWRLLGFCPCLFWTPYGTILHLLKTQAHVWVVFNYVLHLILILTLKCIRLFTFMLLFLLLWLFWGFGVFCFCFFFLFEGRNSLKINPHIRGLTLYLSFWAKFLLKIMETIWITIARLAPIFPYSHSAQGHFVKLDASSVTG